MAVVVMVLASFGCLVDTSSAFGTVPVLHVSLLAIRSATASRRRERRPL